MAKLISVRAELTAIWFICNGNQQLQSRLLSKINKAHFAHNPAKNAFRRITILAKSKGKIPYFEALCEDSTLNDSDRQYLTDFEPKRRVKNKEDVIELYETLENHRLLRSQLDLAEFVFDSIEKESVDTQKVIKEIERYLSEMHVNSNIEDSIYTFGLDANVGSLVDNVLDQDIKDEIIPTGFMAWDHKNGGIPIGSLMGIGANTGGGKTTYGVQLLKNMALYAPTCLVPLEMNAKQMTARLIANCACIDVKNIIQKRLSDRELERALTSIKRFNKEIRDQDSKYSIFSPESDMSFEEIMYSLQPYGYKVILIDYISLLKGIDGEDQWRALGAVARQAKIWAEKNDKIIILLAQLSDDGILKYSKTVKEHCDVFFEFLATDTTKEAGEINVKVTKARGFDPSPFTLGVDYATMRVYDIDNIPDEVQKRKKKVEEKRPEPEPFDPNAEDDDTEEEKTKKRIDKLKKKSKPILDDNEDDDDGNY